MRLPGFLVGSLLLLAACGGSGIGAGAPAAVTIADPGLYLAQQRCPDGGLPTGCAAAIPQRASDRMAWRRSDGGDQVSDSAVSEDGAFWVTTWSYPPHGPFVAGNGDGGEVYVSDGTRVSICCTEDGTQAGIQRFETWGLFNTSTIPCGEGWTEIDRLGRACRATVTYPASGMGLAQITADTIVSEHYSGDGHTGDMERFYLAAGWGRLAWEAYSRAGTPRGGMPMAGPSGGPPAPATLTLTDRRLVTTLVPQVLPFGSVADFAWPPAGFAP